MWDAESVLQKENKQNNGFAFACFIHDHIIPISDCSPEGPTLSVRNGPQNTWSGSEFIFNPITGAETEVKRFLLSDASLAQQQSDLLLSSHASAIHPKTLNSLATAKQNPRLPLMIKLLLREI